MILFCSPLAYHSFVCRIWHQTKVVSLNLATCSIKLGKNHVHMDGNVDRCSNWCGLDHSYLSHSRNGRIKAEYERYIAELELEHQQALAQAQKRSVNTSRAVLKGKMAEQLAPIMPQFEYLPSDAKFWVILSTMWSLMVIPTCVMVREEQKILKLFSLILKAVGRG